MSDDTAPLAPAGVAPSGPARSPRATSRCNSTRRTPARSAPRLRSRHRRQSSLRRKSVREEERRGVRRPSSHRAVATLSPDRACGANQFGEGQAPRRSQTARASAVEPAAQDSWKRGPNWARVRGLGCPALRTSPRSGRACARGWGWAWQNPARDAHGVAPRWRARRGVGRRHWSCGCRPPPPLPRLLAAD